MERFDLVHKAGQEDTLLFGEDFELGVPLPPLPNAAAAGARVSPLAQG